jgi:hypothetical protein
MNTEKRINSYKEYEEKMKGYTDHIEKMMIGKKGQPIPLSVMIVSGEKGVGKSYMAEKILSNQTIRKYNICKDAVSPVDLVKLLWYNNDSIIVLDDISGILTDPKDGASVLKAATETRHMRSIEWRKQNHRVIPVSNHHPANNDEVKRYIDAYIEDNKFNKKLLAKHQAGLTFPDQFYFTGAIIILTNKPLSLIDRYSEGAISNRGWHEEILLTVDGAIDLLKHSVNKMTNFMDTKISVTNVRKALAFMTTKEAIDYYRRSNVIPTLRNLGKIAQEIQNGMDIKHSLLVNNTEPSVY